MTKKYIIYLRKQGKKIREIAEMAGKSSRDVIATLREDEIREAQDSMEDKGAGANGERRSQTV